MSNEVFNAWQTEYFELLFRSLSESGATIAAGQYRGEKAVGIHTDNGTFWFAPSSARKLGDYFLEEGGVELAGIATMLRMQADEAERTGETVH